MENYKKYAHLEPQHFLRLKAELSYIAEDCQRLIRVIEGHQKWIASSAPTKIRHESIDKLHNERWADDLQHNMIDLDKNPVWQSLVSEHQD